jgi:Dyp-type peroxidase family
MGGAPVRPGAVDFADVQGLVRYGYKAMANARYELLRVKDVAAARSWLRAAPVTNAVESVPPPSTALHVAFTAAGLRALGVSESVIVGFSHEFRGGMTNVSRARQLGDAGDNAPTRWEWGYREREPHLVAMWFAERGRLDAFIEASTGDAWRDAFERSGRLDTSDLDGVEPFGFADGASQPSIDWDQARETPCEQLDYTNVTALGEFLLGYRNEYGKLTDRPLLEPDAAGAGLLPAEDAPGKKDLGRNGTYLVMRQLAQDVRGFWQFMIREAGGDFALADRWAAAMVGRTRDGDSPMPILKRPIPGIRPSEVARNQFTYDRDPTGARCPMGAHVRRANPRSADYPGRPTGLAKLVTMLGFGPTGFHDDMVSSVRFHRILRRGREYGPGLTPEEALAPAPGPDPERGLHFICLNASISRQFEFVQNAWMANTKFSGLSGESDPLVGNRLPIPGCPRTAGFVMPKEGGLRHRLEDLPQFVRVRGGAYFFLPSLRALRWFADPAPA